MSGKDDRSKEKRRNMKQYNHHHKKDQGRSTTSSGSPPPTSRRSMVDVADSSDEPRFARRGNWQSGGGGGGRSSLPPQRNRDLLETLPSDSDYVAELGLDGAPIDENARAQLRAGDFQQLAQFSTLGGGHFTFGSEREWANVAEGQTKLNTKAASGYFTLNLSRLNAGLQTIPFYKRMDYPASFFTKAQIVAQEEAAERAETTYQQRILKDSNGISKSRAASAKSNKDAAPAAAEKPATAVPGAEVDELDELLAMTNTQLDIGSSVGPITMPMPMPMVQPATPSSAASKNDVEQWLDSVLDE
ncbi:uncharacterized protein LOC108103945 [Drosophila eugracilis]|uniref:uncharacterized protein LOC108103945 n=1 Tax=Drosophila eugracilis TaxID=29029 RepID=UPI0007E77C95|nr:uncharacterized protein LOC108103945 [Drosophila eugracilis]XP_017065195.1 uncharacterized protein LOC108103945 [Drosophila eugracilis]